MTPATDELAASPLFATLSPQELEHLRVRLEVEPFSEGRVLVREGRHGYAFYVLRDGTARVTVEGREVGQLAPGDFFGEGAILGDGQRHATVTATSDGVAWCMFGTTFRQLEQEHPEIAAQIDGLSSQREAANG